MFLDLANNQMTGAFGENIFQNNPKLKNYYVNQNKLSGYEPVFSQVVSDIKSIYLQSNNFTSMDLDKYLEHFVEMIESCSPSGGGIKIESQSTGASPTNENLIQILNAKGCNVTYD
jgi:vacuolar-type H+-ATPase catalytic subunit A/Vma1